MIAPLTDAIVPEGGPLVQEAVAIVTTGFLLGLGEALCWGKPVVTVEWAIDGTLAPVSRLELHVTPDLLEGERLRVRVKSAIDKPVSRFVARKLIAAGLTLRVHPQHAPVVFNVRLSSEDENGDPLVRGVKGSSAVDLDLRGEAPTGDEGWVWATGNFTAKNFVPGESFGVKYRLVASNKFLTWLARRFLRVEGQVTSLSIHTQK